MIYAIKIEDNNCDDPSVWNYIVVYQDSDKLYYEAPVATAWLEENLDGKYIRDLRNHHYANKYLCYDRFGKAVCKNF